MLGARTKQINSYGRRGSRIVNASDRRDRESASSSTSDVESVFLKRENAVVISPAKPRIAPRRLQGATLTRSPRNLSRNMQPKTSRNNTAKRIRTKLESDTQIREPLTPLRLNGTLSNEQLSSRIKAKSKSCTIKPARSSLKLYVPVILDIMVLDEDGNMLTQERRLSPQANHVRTAAGRAEGKTRRSPPSLLPIPFSDDSNSEADSPPPVLKALNRRFRAIVDSPNESTANNTPTVCNLSLSPLTKSRSRSQSVRVEEAVPPAPSRKSQAPRKFPSPSPLNVTPTKILATSPLPFLPRAVAVPTIINPSTHIAKPRQLTPIRGRSSRSIFHHPPSTPTEADLSLDLERLNLSDVTEIDGLPAQPAYLLPLLQECAQPSPYEFSAFIETFPFDPIVQSSSEDEDVRFRKIGEASYSEVFGIGDVVLKIIPIRCEEEAARPVIDEVPAPSDAKDVLKEIVVTREIGEICESFVKLSKTYVVRGRYPSLLLDLWDEYNERKGSESIRPDSFGLTQVYAIIILPNGGPDLESFVFKNVSKTGWHQACGIFWQVARALEQAESLVNFEHRDLHWGQILVKSIPTKRSTKKCARAPVSMDDTRFGVKVTVIDLGLSRMSAADAQSSKIYWTPFDDEIFEGEGDYQYDVYRMMRNHISGAWKAFHPLTNVMWLHYLVTKLLHEKHLKFPGGRRQSGGETRLVCPTGYDERECYECLVEMEKLLGDCVTPLRKGQKGRRKTVVPSSGPKSAREVVAYGKRREWIH